MKKIFILFFTIFSFHAYAFDISLFKDTVCKEENLGEIDKNIKSSMYTCTYKKNISFLEAYNDVINIISSEINQKNNLISNKVKSDFNSKINNLKTKQYNEYVIKEKTKDGIVYIMSRNMGKYTAEVSTNMAVMDEYYSFIVTEESGIIQLTVSSFKGNEYIEANKNFIE